MKRLDNNFDEWDREADRLQGMGLLPRALKGLDDQSHLYKNLQRKNWTGLSRWTADTRVYLVCLSFLFGCFRVKAKQNGELLYYSPLRL